MRRSSGATWSQNDSIAEVGSEHGKVGVDSVCVFNLRKPLCAVGRQGANSRYGAWGGC